MDGDIISLDTLQDFDNFFYYGQNDLELETKHDLLCNLKQPKRTLFYDRCLDAAGVDDYENKPAGVTIQVLLPYDIVNAIGMRNQYVSNGEGNTRDRRVAVTQSQVTVDIKSGGYISVAVYYIPLADLKERKLSAGVGAGKL